MPSKRISPRVNTSNPLFNSPHHVKTLFTQCQHLKPPFQLTPCAQNTFYPMPTPPTPFSTANMPRKHISPNANTSNPLFNYPHALKAYFTQCQHLKPPFQLPPCPQNTLHPMPTPPSPFSTSPMPGKTHFTQCHHLTPPFQLPPCPENTFHTVPTPQTTFSTAPMPSKRISPRADTSNPLFNSRHALKTHFTQCQHLQPPFHLPPCPQNIFHTVPTPQTSFSTTPMPSKHISPSANTSNPLSNCPHALKTHFTPCQHLHPPFQLPPYPQNIFHTVPTPQTPFATAPMPSKHISPSANTTNPLFNCLHALKTHFIQCQHFKPPFHLPAYPVNIFHPVPTPQTPFSTDPMPSKHISPNANTSNPLFNCPHALKTYFTQCQHLKPPFQLHPCPQNTFHPMPTPQTPFSSTRIPSKHISHSANTSHPLFNCPHALKTHFTECQHLKPRFQLPPCPQNRFHPTQTPQTPFSTAPMPSKHISHSANTSNPLSTAPMPSKDISPSANTSNPLNCPHALKAYFIQCQHLKPPFRLPPCPQNTFHPVPTPQTAFSTARMPSKHISSNANTSNPLFIYPHTLKTYFTQCQHSTTPFQLPPCPENTFHIIPISRWAPKPA